MKQQEVRVMNARNQKIKLEHLNRRAVVYIRQSSLRQVQENVESQRLQYALADRAKTLGWHEVEVIDTDLGVSAAVGSTRVGFEHLITSIALGEVGIVLSREVSRLSRNDKDWCHLVEVCVAYGTLIGDEDQIYDLNLMDDQLVLGIKGTMSVVELNVLKMRMLQGRIEKAKRGEYFTRIPPGYVLDGDRKIVKDPDDRVRQAISLVFDKFRELWSARQTRFWFIDNNIQLPVNQCRGGKVEIVWRLPKESFVLDILSNPFYAGAYVYGRGETQTILRDGRLVKRRTRPSRVPDRKSVV